MNMATLYLDRQNMALRLEHDRLCIVSSGVEVQSVPLQLVDRVVVLAHATIDSRVLSSLAARGAVLSIVSRRDPTLVATVGVASRPSASRRILQYRTYTQESARLALARAILGHKLRMQANLLRRTAAVRTDAGHLLLQSAAQIGTARDSVAVSSIRSLLGIEGSAAAAYFSAYSKLFAPSLGFTTRNRRPPRDAVNVCLSLGYTLIHIEAVRSAALAGLDPYIGFLHDLQHGRESLACDLVELERVRVDEWVFAAFRDRVLRDEHFRRTGATCLLGAAGRKAFYGAFQPVADTAARRLKHWALALVRWIRGDTNEDGLAESVPDAEQSVPA